MTGRAAETALGSVPVLPLMGHLALVHTDGISAGVAVLGEHGVEAVQAVWPSLSHDVPLTAQLAIALEAAEVTHVPSLALGLRALVCEDYLHHTPGEGM